MYESEYELQDTVGDRKRINELRIYDSIKDLVEHGVDNSDDQLGERMSTFRRGSWVGREFSDWSDVKDAANSHWEDGLKVIDRMATDLADAKIPKPVSRRRKLKYDVSNGDEVDYDRLRSGQEFWRTTRRENQNGPATITIYVGVAANCGVDHEDILWRGAAAIALADLLEAADYRVAIYAVAKSEGTYEGNGGKNGATIAYRLKDHSEPIDRSSLVNAVSGWFFRSVVFAEYCQSHKGRTANGGLGHSVALNENDMQQISQDKAEILIDKAFSYDDALRRVRESLEKITG